MKLCTDDGRFGVVISPAGEPWDARFFTFQLLIDGVVVGDTDPNIVYYAVERLQRLEEVSDPRLSLETSDVATVLDAVRVDDDLQHRLIGSWTESLDQWCVVAYLFNNDAVWIAMSYDEEGHLDGPALAIRVPVKAYTDVASQVGSYWREHSSRAR